MKILTSLVFIFFSITIMAQEETKTDKSPKSEHVIFECVATYSDNYEEIITSAKHEDIKKAAKQAKRKILMEVTYPNGSPADYIEASKVYCKSDTYNEIK